MKNGKSNLRHSISIFDIRFEMKNGKSSGNSIFHFRFEMENQINGTYTDPVDTKPVLLDAPEKDILKWCIIYINCFSFFAADCLQFMYIL